MPDTLIAINTCDINRRNNRQSWYRHVPEDVTRPAWTQTDFTGKDFQGRRFNTTDHSKGIRVGN